MSKKNEYYSLERILATNCRYNIIIGERSNGKTTQALIYGLKRFVESGGVEQFAVLRRWKEDVKASRCSVLFDTVIKIGVVDELTKGDYNSVTYSSAKWYLSHTDDDGNTIINDRPFAFAFSMSDVEHDKSTSYPDVTTIIFDEFISRDVYIDDEFMRFMHTLSTIIRDRDNVKIFMLGNTVNKYCPYFKEMGLKNVRKMEQGTIDIYEYGSSGLRVAVEFCDTALKRKTKKKSDIYFAFDNPHLQMITTGAWELDIYPHLQTDYTQSDVRFIFFIIFDGQTLQCEVVHKHTAEFIYIHRKTTPIKHNTDLVYTPSVKADCNYRRYINKPVSSLERRIWGMFTADKVFYQDNEIGEIVSNYIRSC